MRTIALTEETRKNVLENLLKRSPSSYGKFEDAVAEIVENVRNNKDAAVVNITKNRKNTAGLTANRTEPCSDRKSCRLQKSVSMFQVEKQFILLLF